VLRILKYCWFVFIMRFTGLLPDFTIVNRLRGWLVRPCFKHCGRRFELCSGATFAFTSNIGIGNDVFVANGCWVHGLGGITIEDEVLLGPFTVLVSVSHTRRHGSFRRGELRPGPIILGRGCWTGAHVTVLPGRTVGPGTVVGAGSVVAHDLPAHALCAGVPAQVVRSFEEPSEFQASTP